MGKKKYTYSKQSMASYECSLMNRDDKYLMDYSKMKKKYNFSDNGIAALHQIVDVCCEIQGEICGMADSIKIDMLKEAQEINKKYQEGDISINKAVCVEMVSRASKSDTPKTQARIDKYAKRCNTLLYAASLRKSFCMSYFKNEKSIQVLDKTISIERGDLTNSDTFYKLLNDAARVRYYIDNVLYAEYHNLAKAASYLTNGAINYTRLKKLVDYEYYAGHGEKGQYKDKALCDVKKIIDTYKMYDAYGFSYMQKLFKDNGFELKRIEKKK